MAFDKPAELNRSCKIDINRKLASFHQRLVARYLQERTGIASDVPRFIKSNFSLLPHLVVRVACVGKRLHNLLLELRIEVKSILLHPAQVLIVLIRIIDLSDSNTLMFLHSTLLIAFTSIDLANKHIGTPVFHSFHLCRPHVRKPFLTLL